MRESWGVNAFSGSSRLDRLSAIVLDAESAMARSEGSTPWREFGLSIGQGKEAGTLTPLPVTAEKTHGGGRTTD
jgi:hypothetical protein